MSLSQTARLLEGMERADFDVEAAATAIANYLDVGASEIEDIAALIEDLGGEGLSAEEIAKEIEMEFLATTDNFDDDDDWDEEDDE